MMCIQLYRHRQTLDKKIIYVADLLQQVLMIYYPRIALFSIAIGR